MTNSGLAGLADGDHVPGRWEAATAPRTTLSRRRKRPEDTAEGCLALAAADLGRAADSAGEHLHWRYRHSAAAWTARAGLLAGLEAKFEALGEPKPA